MSVLRRGDRVVVTGSFGTRWASPEKGTVTGVRCGGVFEQYDGIAVQDEHRPGEVSNANPDEEQR